jgi:two-component system, chemotaxis family, protein-glutamate methylesterase/glutaminase
MSEPKYIVVVGASAGGFNSIVELCAQLKDTMPAAVFITLHLTKIGFGEVLVQQVQKNTPFTCKIAEDGEQIKTHHVYLSVPDKHLVIERGKIVLGTGPAENRWRPSIDVLFRSAAAAYDGRVIGIILTGLMQDGTAGMLAVKRCGGTCIVQDPEQAEYPDMPQSVLNNMKVDYCVPLEMMGEILEEKTSFEIPDHYPIPDDVQAEARIAKRVATGMENISPIGTRSDFVCPDCGGGLWEMVSDNIVRYRCYTGHVYNENELLIRQDEALENTLWIALRMMEERKHLLEKMAGEENRKGYTVSSKNKSERAEELNRHIDKLKTILFNGKAESIDKQIIQNTTRDQIV